MNSSLETPTLSDAVIEQPSPVERSLAPRLLDLALAAIGECVRGDSSSETSPEVRRLHAASAGVAEGGAPWCEQVANAILHPAPADQRLVRLAAALKLSDLEILVVALVAAAEIDATVARTITYVQAPAGTSRPTLGLLEVCLAPLSEELSPLATLVNGTAVRSGLLTLGGESRPLVEQTLAIPGPLGLALAGFSRPWPGATADTPPGGIVQLPVSVCVEAGAQAAGLLQSTARGLVIRSPSVAEAGSAVVAVAQALERRPLFLAAEPPVGLGPFLHLTPYIPVFRMELGPGERRTVPSVPGWGGPVLVMAGVEGAIECADGLLPNWQLPVPDAEERESLWRAAFSRESLDGANWVQRAWLREFAAQHRHGAGRIAQLARLAGHFRARRGSHGSREMDPADLADACWSGEGSGLETLAEPMRHAVPDDALVVSPELRSQLSALVRRCRARDRLAHGLGPAAQVRYRPGVRALFSGPSGTGKTLAAGWLASRLSRPLYRVDLAAVTSKYIGETEKNLARLLAVAERDDVLLLFDEADALLGRRTDVHDSNDRFANAQTNYLLQRLENYDGIVLLTSNSRQRFDSGFTRRLDVVVEFKLPSPEERRALWLAHLGPQHALESGELNRLAALAEIPGGHIRNAVLAAALGAMHSSGRIGFAECLHGLEAEYRKLARPLPAGLSADRRTD